MHDTQVHASGARMRWIELPGSEPARVYVHGLGAMSAPYFAGVAADPLLAGHRSLFVDLLGFGLSDRPADFGYTLEEHADALAEVIAAAGAGGAQLIGHSMGGAVAIVLAARHPGLVSNLVLVDANLDPISPVPARAGGSGIAAYTEEEFLRYGRDEVRDRVGPNWWATMRLADPVALYRTAVNLARGTTPTMRKHLLGLEIPRAYLHPAQDGSPKGADALQAAGVRLVPIPDSGHNIMLDNPGAFARATSDLLAGSPA
ncbi:alpha/beta fold hydrolase [Sphaerisporangium perillae]|uniref:alpha/beta fold hydrolase n=1 Tax=Sphaerisporangium perillae TaxID=2935860 RepID=UPI00200CE6E8|nr:alpha/beta hydrolase [Sphaerisporangium perillae]